MLPTLAVGCMGFNIEERGSRALLQSSWHVHCCCRRSAFVVRQFNSRQPSGLNKLAIELSSSMDAGFILALPFLGGLCTG